MKPRGPALWRGRRRARGAAADRNLRTRTLPTGPMLGEHDGSIQSLVMQYTAGAQFVWPVYRQFLNWQMPALKCTSPAPVPPTLPSCAAALGPLPCALIPIYTGHVMTAWARDRWVELLPAAPGAPVTLLAPQGELQQEIWPQCRRFPRRPGYRHGPRPRRQRPPQHPLF